MKPTLNRFRKRPPSRRDFLRRTALGWMGLSAVSNAFAENPIRSRASAHRGDIRVAPENTLPAFESAVSKGAHQIEFDVRQTKDGELVLMHDPTVDRTTNGQGNVTELTFDEIRGLDAGNWFSVKFAGTKVPTFKETLEIIPPWILCNCHIKGSPEVASKATKLIREMGRMDQCFLAATVEQARAAKKVAPEIRICNMSRQSGPLSSYPDETIRLGCEFIQLLGSTERLKETVRKLHQHAIIVNYFHGTTEETIRELIEAEVDYILTNNLDLCLRILAEYGVQPAHP